MENTSEESKVNEQLNNLDINKEESNENTETATKLSKGQKKRLKEKEKKLKQQQEQESGITSTTTPTTKPETPKPETPKPETPTEKFNRQIEWAIYQLILGQQRKDTTKEQWKESETIINKLKSDKIHDARKIQLMHSVFGKNLDKVMKQYPLPKNVESITKAELNTSTLSTEPTTSSSNTTSSTEATTATTSN